MSFQWLTSLIWTHIVVVAGTSHPSWKSHFTEELIAVVVCLHSESTLKEQFSQEKSSLLQSIHNNSALISEKDLLVENLKSEVGIVSRDLPESWTSASKPVCLSPPVRTESKAVKVILKSLPASPQLNSCEKCWCHSLWWRMTRIGFKMCTFLEKMLDVYFAGHIIEFDHFNTFFFLFLLEMIESGLAFLFL